MYTDNFGLGGYTAGMACEMTFVSSVGSGEQDGRENGVRTYAVT
jgi:hypothetical protein